jgi:hypothetical protein
VKEARGRRSERPGPRMKTGNIDLHHRGAETPPPARHRATP